MKPLAISVIATSLIIPTFLVIKLVLETLP